MRQPLVYISIVAFGIILFSCNSNRKNPDDESPTQKNAYAAGFEIQDSGEFTRLTVKNPWQGAERVHFNYVLIPKGDEYNPPKEENVIHTPVERVVCLSTTHIAFIDALDKTETIVGISGSHFVSNPILRERILQENLPDVGYDNHLNYELISSLNPDLVIAFGVGSNVASYNQKLNEMGIPTVLVAEYLEATPLGKTEWLKFFGALFEEEEKAEQWFNKVSENYQETKNRASGIVNKPEVITGLPWKGTWYVPGGHSFFARMIEDAGGHYMWKENESRESIPLDIEAVFDRAQNADYWINIGNVTKKSDILEVDERMAQFNPYLLDNLYNYDKRMNRFGGNDFWETGVTRPDLVLKDLFKIFHPEKCPLDELYFYRKIEE